MSVTPETAITLPFTIGANGVVNTTTDQKKIWQDRVLSALGTGWGERILKFDYGSKIYQEVFEDMTLASEMIEKEIYVSFAKMLPRLTLEKVNIIPETSSGVINVEVVYRLPDDVLTSTVLGTVRVDGNNPPKEL